MLGQQTDTKDLNNLGSTHRLKTRSFPVNTRKVLTNNLQGREVPKNNLYTSTPILYLGNPGDQLYGNC